MYSWVSLNHFRDWCEGTASGAWRDLPVTTLSTDTRAIKPGDVFLALKGESFDAHDFISQAVKNGAAAVISEREVNESVPVLLVKDTLKALIAIGHGLRAEFAGKVIAVTGSAGKSSTKEMIATLLGPETVCSPASFNNLMGVSRTLCLVQDETKTLVLEMGMNAPREIEELCDTFKPHAGCITNIGDAHIGKMGGKEGIYLAKKEMFDFLAKTGGSCIGVALNLDDPLVEKAYQEAFNAPVPTVTYSAEGQTAEVCLYYKGVDPKSGFLHLKMNIRGDDTELRLPLFGLHQAQNIAAATAAVIVLGLPTDEFVPRYALIRAASHRGEILSLREGRVVIDESYNSNPTALLSSLTSLMEIDRGRRRVLVIGDMFELGEFGERLHAEVGEALVRLRKERPFPLLVLGVGTLVEHFLDPLRKAFPDVSVHHVRSQAAAYPLLEPLLAPGDIIFIKGSRGTLLDKVVASFQAHG